MRLEWLNVPQEAKASWERAWPERLVWEIQTLGKHGRVLGVSRSRDGGLRIDVAWTVGGAEEPIAVIYPPGFPYVRPDVYLMRDPVKRPRRHCDPTSGRLCYLGHAPMAWSPDTAVADVIQDALPAILFGGSFEEEPIGEPAEVWWANGSPRDSVFVVESGWGPGGHRSGELRIRGSFDRGKPMGLRCVVEQVTAEGGAVLHRSSQALPLEFASADTYAVSWFRFDDELWPTDRDAILDRIVAAAGKARRLERATEGSRARLIAAVFKTEVEHERWDWSWLLLMMAGSDRALRTGEGRVERVVVRTLRAGPTDRMARARSAEPLCGRQVVVAGVGAIGAPIAIDLARNGVARLGLVDDDWVGPGNAVRWPFGESAWGKPKVEVLKSEIARASAATIVDTHRLMLGTVDLDLPGPASELGRSLDGADVIVDATVSFDALRVLWARARTAGRTIVSVGATPSVDGGEVVVYAPGGACPVCLVRHRVDGTIPAPRGEAGDAGAIRLPGCAEATFAGSSFDLGELSLAATRAVVAELRSPSSATFIDVLDFTEADRLPSWRRHAVERHDDCACR